MTVANQPEGTTGHRVLRPHQVRAIAEVFQAIRMGYKRPMLQMPTGAGKTLTSAGIIQRGLSAGRRMIFTVPTIDLVDQAVRDFYAEGIRDVGVIQANHHMTDPSKPVQVASLQTLARREIPSANLVIIDEAHRTYRFVEEWMMRDEWVDVPFLGLSATPWKKGLGRLYDKLIIATTTAELIDAGFLAPFRVFAPSRPDLSAVKVERGDYREDQLSEVMSERTLVANVVSTWKQLGEGRPTLCFAVDRTHAKTLQVEFEQAGVSCGYIDGTMERPERDEVRRKFECGAYKVVCNVGVLTTGVDWDVRCIVLARPTKSEMLYVQIIGRGLRTADGKSDCLILDHSTTTLNLGFVTDIHHDRLCDGTMDLASKGQDKPKEPPKPSECPACHYVKAPGVRGCPSCGHVHHSVSKVETKEGELVDLAKDNRVTSWADKLRFMAQVKAYAKLHNRAEGWVAHTYKAKFGVWPNDRRLKGCVAAPSVSPEVASWIKSRDIRHAKRRQAA